MIGNARFRDWCPRTHRCQPKSKRSIVHACVRACVRACACLHNDDGPQVCVHHQSRSHLTPTPRNMHVCMRTCVYTYVHMQASTHAQHACKLGTQIQAAYAYTHAHAYATHAHTCKRMCTRHAHARMHSTCACAHKLAQQHLAPVGWEPAKKSQTRRDSQPKVTDSAG